MKTIVGLYDDWTTASQVVEELSRAGFSREDISLVANDADQTYADSLGTTDVDSGSMAAEGAATGALTGGALGGVGGLLLGLGALAIPGVGPVIAAGPIAAGLTGAAIGAVGGGIVGALAGWGVPEEEAGYYAEGVRRGGTLVGVQADDHEVDQALAIMNRFGPVNLEHRSNEWRMDGWTGFDPDSDVYTSDVYASSEEFSGSSDHSGRGWATVEPDNGNHRTTMTDMDVDRVEGERAIPIVEEELRVGKREVERGTVRVHTYVEETPVQEDVTLREERVTVNRRPVDRAADTSDIDAFRERTIEMTETAEEVVAEKTARVVEEVVIGKEVDTHTERVEDTLRRTQVDVDKTGGQSMGWNSYDAGWRTHYNQYFGSTGHDYNYYQPGYRYGYDIANDARYNGRDWDLIETDVRRDWEATGRGAWEEFKDSIRHGWNEVRRAMR